MRSFHRKSKKLDGYGFMSPSDKPRLTQKPTNRAERRKLASSRRRNKIDDALKD